MDKNSSIGLVLIFAIVLGYTYMKAPSAEERARLIAEQDSIAQVEQAQEDARIQEAAKDIPEEPVEPVLLDSAAQAKQDSIKALEAQSRFGMFQGSASGNNEEVILDNGLIKLQLSSKGAMPAVIQLNEYKQYAGDGNGAKIQLFDPDSNDFHYHFNADGHVINTSDLFFKIHEKTDTRALFRANAGNGKYVELSYALNKDSYLIDHSMNIVGLREEVDPAGVSLNWSISGNKNEKSVDYERQSCSVFYKYIGEDRDYLKETGSDSEALEGKAEWVAFKQKFFSLAMCREEGFSYNGSRISVVPSENEEHTKSFNAVLYFDEYADDNVSLKTRIYAGPNHIQTLEDTGIAEFDRIIDLGWWIFGWMNRWLIIPIFNWLSNFGWSYGIIILVLTIIIKGILFPVTWKNYMSSAKMRVLRPEIDKVNEKFKDKDPMKKQQATMDLYRKTGVNPMAGCLPALLQMPILYAMFRFFPSSIELRQQAFLWADDLSNYDSIMDLPFEIPFYGAHVSLFTLLMAASTFFYTRMNSSQMPTQPGMPNMKVIFALFPFMMLFFFNSFSSGLSYYYLLANFISIAQMFIIKRFLIDEDKIKLQLEANKKKPKKKSRWMQKMEDIQKQQEAQRRQGSNKRKR